MSKASWLAQYDAGVPEKIDYEELTIADFLRRSAKQRGDRPALIFLNRRMTYAELDDHVERFASGLAARGVKQGTRVAIQLPNLPQTVIAFQAAMRLGAEVVMTNPLYTLREIEHQWQDSGIELAVVSDFIFAATIEPNLSKLAPKRYITASIPDYLKFPLNLLAPLKLKGESPPKYAKIKEVPGQVERFMTVLKSATGPAPTSDRDLDQVAVLQYTGGTTGPAKGAMLTHRNLSCNAQQIDKWFVGSEPGHEVVLTALPLFHVFGLSVCMNWAILGGNCLLLLPNPRDTETLVKSVAKHRVTLFPAVPALFNSLNNFPGIENIDVSSVKSCFSGSAPIAPDVLKRFEELTGSRILEGFGMSETSPVSHVNPLQGERKIGSVGIPLSDTEAKVVEPGNDDKEMPIGEEGELLVRGPQVMKGYWNRPEASAESLAGGWMHTGDLATVDEQGYFRIVGRAKDMINVSGMKVYPDEVDSVLMAHDAIFEAATIGVPDPKVGETVKSFVVLQPGATLNAEGVKAYARENLADYKVPRHVEFLDELPKSTVMKVLRRELREMEAAKRS